jgi:hypothetical protein
MSQVNNTDIESQNATTATTHHKTWYDNFRTVCFYIGLVVVVVQVLSLANVIFFAAFSSTLNARRLTDESNKQIQQMLFDACTSNVPESPSSEFTQEQIINAHLMALYCQNQIILQIELSQQYQLKIMTDNMTGLMNYLLNQILRMGTSLSQLIISKSH